MLTAIKILQVGIHPTSYDETTDRIAEWVNNKESRFIICANVHVVMTGVTDKNFLGVLQQADRITPDGMPLVWGLRLLGNKAQQRVYGPDLMMAWCDRAQRNHSSVFLYGSSDDVLQKLKQTLTDRFPLLEIAGTHAPAFGEINPDRDLEMITRSGADVLFVALGCPKQELWMSAVKGRLPMVMIGVGAAFAFHAGTVPQAPRWMMAIGLEWLFRLFQEPKRLWKRYLLYNSLFVILFSLQLLHYYLLSFWKIIIKEEMV